MNISYLDVTDKSLKEIKEAVINISNEDKYFIVKNVSSNLSNEILDFIQKETNLKGSLLQENTKISIKKNEVYLIPENLNFSFDGISIESLSNNNVFNWNEIIEHSLNEIYIFNKSDLKFEYVNEGALKNLGFTLSEMKSKTPLDIKPEHTLNTFEKIISPLVKSRQKKILFETTHQRKDGSLYPVEVHLQLLKHNNKDYYSAVILDCSDKYRAIEKAKKSYKTLELLASNYPNGSISLIDAELNILFTEGEGYEIHNVDPSSFLGKPAKEVLHPEIFKKLETASKKISKTKASFSYDVSFNNRIFENTCKPILNKSHEFEYYVLRVLDVTDERINKELLSIEKNNFESINAALNRSALVSITDSKGIITHANEVFCSASKFSIEKLIGNRHSIINSGYHPKSFWTNMWKTILSGETWRADVKNKAKDGSFYWVDTVVNPILNVENEIISFLSIRYLITDKKEMQERKEELTKRFSLATKAAKMGVWTYKVETRAIFWDEKMLEIYPIESFDGRFETFENLIHEKYRENELNSVFKYIEDENVFEYDIQYQVNINNLEEVYIKGKAIIERENGVAKKITEVVWEVTGEKLAENALKQLTNKIKIATQAAKMGIWTWNMATNYVEWDDYQYKLYGIDHYDGSYEAWKNMIHSDDVSLVTASAEESLKNNTELNYSFRIISHPEK